MLAGSAHGRMSQQSIRAHSPSSTLPHRCGATRRATIGDGANADGRVVLHTLTAWNLWLRGQAR